MNARPSNLKRVPSEPTLFDPPVSPAETPQEVVNGVKICSRVIHSLDWEGNVLGIQWEPAGYAESRRIFVVQTRDLINKVNEMLYHLDARPDKYFPNDERRHGYKIALEELRASDAVESLKNAVRDLRPYLEVAAKFLGGIERRQG